ncbi:MAG: hypothetical protein CSYNP_02385 [Syntrophus sp. SKADARSKE-3]|nr:hypothetical protein [Syntrophus sp. SKADARSKE-3]
MISANSAVQDATGRIFLKATKGVTLDKDSVTSANGPQGGEISIQTDTGDSQQLGVLENRGTISAHSGDGAGGSIKLSSGIVSNLGTLDASGATGGSVTLNASAIIDSSTTLVTGTNGKGGLISQSTRQIDQTSFARLDASGSLDGGQIITTAGAEIDGCLLSSAALSAQGMHGNGGSIVMTGYQTLLTAADLKASGAQKTGSIHIGGGWQGKDASIANANTTIVNGGTQIRAEGSGGEVTIWSDGRTIFDGTITAPGAMTEVSGRENLAFGGLVNAKSLLLDPKNITIGTSSSSALNYLLINNPNASSGDDFGSSITELSNGNLVITAPSSTVGGVASAGKAYLMNGTTGAVISILAGSTAGDQVGYKGVTALTNGNYVVGSTYWNNGAINKVGAVTWGSGATGISGVVSAVNSLVGSTANDYVGSGGVTALTNGNYVVSSPYWDKGAVANAGAATLGNGATGISGVVSVANSLVGSTADDCVGSKGVTALTNGNYVVSSPSWKNGAAYYAGAVTWGDGSTGGTRLTGAISAANSLVGSTTSDSVGSNGVTALTNGNYVVSSPSWENGAAYYAGAVTWGDGSTGGTRLTGAISAANSLVGSAIYDYVGSGGVTALTNSNYVVTSPKWRNGAANSAGAVTWGNGTTGTIDVITSANSLVGSTANDQVGYKGVTALTNGNYVVSSPYWNNGAATSAGAATWGDGTTGISGVVSAANSMVGSRANDYIGYNGVTALTNGNYVVSSPSWNNGAAYYAGAVTWGNGTTGISGVVSVANSLVGSTANDNIGNGGVTALTNGNYVVSSPNWNNGTATQAGAVTWGNGTTGTIDVITSANSLVGSTAGDQVGYKGVTALTNGNYAVSSPHWNIGTAIYAGAVTWGDGSTGGTRLTGAISSANSLVGSTTYDCVGNNGVTALTNGNYVVNSPYWNSYAGAVTWGNGATGISGVVSASNSLLGDRANANFGSYVTTLNINNRVAVADKTGGTGGRVYILDGTTSGGSDSIASATYANNPGVDSTITPATLTSTLNTGTAVTLQANNDITLSAALTANNSGNGGNLTLAAGRSILLNADITTDNGNLTLIANETSANGVVTAQRDAGTAVITSTGALLNTGTGNIQIELRDGAGRTGGQAQSGDISLGILTGRNIAVSNAGPGAVAQTGTITTTGTAGSAGGNVTISATGGITTGTITALGGANTGAGGYAGGAVNLTSTGGSVVTGAISTTGSNAVEGMGGAGGSVTISGASGASSIGNINTSAGASATAASAYDGAAGGNVVITAGTGTLNVGAITTDGANQAIGNALLASLGGGNAGNIGLSGSSVTVGGNLHATGGDTAGGAAGSGSWLGGIGGGLSITGTTLNLSGSVTNIGGLNYDIDHYSGRNTGGSVTFNANNTTLTGAMNSGTLNISGGTVTLNGATNTNNLNFSGGTLGGTGTVTLTGTGNWSGGNLASTLLVDSGSTLNLNTGNPKYLGGSTLTNNGTVNWNAGHLWSTSATSAFINNSLFDIKQDSSLWGYNGGCATALTNSATGTIRKSAGTGTLQFDHAYLSNAGLFQIQSGSVQLIQPSATATHTGTFEIASGSTLDFNQGTHNLTSASSMTGAGNLTVSGATVNVDGTYGITGNVTVSSGTANFNPLGSISTPLLTVSGGTANFSQPLSTPILNFSGGTLGGTGTMSTTGSVNINGGTYLNGKTWNNTGTIDISGGGILWLSNAATLNNQVGGTILFSGTNSFPISWVPGSGNIINNAGTLRKTSTVDQWLGIGGGYTNNTGFIILDANTGLLKLQDGGTHTGSFSVASGSTLELDGNTHNLTSASSLTGAGTIRISGATVNVNTDAFNIANLNLFSGALSGTGSIAVTNNYVHTGGTLGATFKNLSLAKTGNFAVEPLTATNAISLSATGNITQTGVLTADTLNVTNTAGSTDLSTQANQITHLGTISTAGQNFSIRNAGNIDLSGNVVASSATLTAGGSITDSVATGPAIIASTLNLTAETGIGIGFGNSGTPLKTQVSTLTATNTGASGDINILNTGALTTSGWIANGNPLNTSGGNVSIVAQSPLTIGGSGGTGGISALNKIWLEAGSTGAGATTDNLTINGDVYSDTNKAVTLRAGNNIIENGTICTTCAVTKTANLNPAAPTPPPTPATPTLAQCTADPTLPGCSTVLPSLSACTTDPMVPGCSAVLPTITACTTAPTTPGCTAVLPSIATCTTNPTAPGCSAVLPTIATCTTNPTAPGCSAVLPTIATCTTNPATPGCSAVLPTLATCTATPTTPGCSAVLPTLATCTATPTAPGCSAVLPTLVTCTATPTAPGCSAVLPTLATCTTAPKTPGCSAVLPTLATCTTTPTVPGCSAVLPTLATCTTAPTTPGCSAVLPTLATCTTDPTTPGCSPFLPAATATYITELAPATTQVVKDTSSVQTTPVAPPAGLVLVSLVKPQDETTTSASTTTSSGSSAFQTGSQSDSSGSQTTSQSGGSASQTSAQSGDSGSKDKDKDKKKDKDKDKDKDQQLSSGDKKDAKPKKNYCN